MALTPSLRVVALALGAALLFAGCLRGPAAPSPRPPAATPPGAAPVATDWEAFRRTGIALEREIARRAEALRSGPVGNRAAELASLRLADSGRDLIDSGSLDGAREALERAVSLDGGNGFAYLYLAYVHHVQGRPDLAAEFLSSARRFLPTEPGVHAELEGLRRSILQAEQATAT